jgi:caa(3)-type oxidase subunit IV
MAEQHPEPNYGGVWWFLLALTIAEVLVAMPWLGIAHMPKVVLLVGLALSKASLVALYFMHLRFERSTLLVIASTPLIICAFLLFMLMPDQGGMERTSEIRAEKAQSAGH